MTATQRFRVARVPDEDNYGMSTRQSSDLQADVPDQVSRICLVRGREAANVDA